MRLRSVSSSLLMEHREKTHSGHALNLALCQRTPAATRQTARMPKHQNRQKADKNPDKMSLLASGKVSSSHRGGVYFWQGDCGAYLQESSIQW
jgi:hypothetical protein